MTIKDLEDYVFTKAITDENHEKLKEFDNIRTKAILIQNYMIFKGLNNDIFKKLSEKSFREAKEVTYKLIEEDNEDPYL